MGYGLLARFFDIFFHFLHNLLKCAIALPTYIRYLGLELCGQRQRVTMPSDNFTYKYIVQTLHTLLLACQLFPIRNIWRCSLLILISSTLLDPSLSLSLPPSLPLLLFLSPSLPSPHSFSSFWYRCCEC